MDLRCLRRLFHPRAAATGLALLALWAAAPGASAQAPASPPAGTAPEASPPAATTPDATAPAVTAPALPGDDDDALSSPPVVDPKGVGTQAVPAAPDGIAAADGNRDPQNRPDGYGELVELQPRAVLTRKGQSSWEEGYVSIVNAVKETDAELARMKLKPAGPPMVVYTATDDAGFDFEVALPFAGATTEKPLGGLTFSASPAGRAMRFTHRGSYDAMDPTYEQIANLLDAKDLEAQDLYIEEYRSDPRSTSPDDLVIDIYVPLK